jgi:putative sporulation protein YtxC
MITIQFRNRADAYLIHQYLLETDKQKELITKLVHRPETLLKIKSVKVGKSFFYLVIPVFTRFILTEIEGRWIKEMITSLFYYTDTEEQDQILAIARSILDEEKNEIPQLPHQKDNMTRKQILNEAFLEFITESVSFSFESFLQFRLKDYRTRLLTYVERAIDEYMLEQEYQTFIDTLRHYVQEKQSPVEIINLLYSDTFFFYDENLSSISTEELNDKWKEEICEHIKKVESGVLKTLLSIAPKKINLYTDKIDEGIVRTIQNIFQERVIMYPLKQFQHNAVSKK